MVLELQELLKKSYAPYSSFPVACIVTMKDGKKFSGVNVENASYGATICAERNAIASAVTDGYKKGDFSSISIMVDRDQISSCCFLCRQVIVEFFDDDCEIIMMNKQGQAVKSTVKDMCPLSFSRGDLI